MSEGPTRLKSPPYPSLTLEAALQRAMQLREVAKGFPVPLQSAARAWGYSPTSSSVVSVAGALNQFGLIEDAGAGEVRRIKVSSLGDAILMDKRPNSRIRAESLRTAALTPKVFQELWEKFHTSEVDEHTLVYELTLGRSSSGKAQYSEPAAQDVAKKYVESLRYAGLSAVVENGEQEAPTHGSHENERLGGRQQEERSGIEGHTTAEDWSASSCFEERKSLDEGSAVLIWPKLLGPDSVDDMEYWLLGVLRQIKRRAKKTQGETGED